MRTLPLIIEPKDLEPLANDPDLLIVDMCKPQTYAQGHIPGAVHLEYAAIILGLKPVPGLLPDEARLSSVFSGIGLTPDKHVVAYDEEGSSRASRLIWTLDVIGHTSASALNGGIFAWANEGHPLSSEPGTPTPSQYRASIGERGVATRDYIERRLNDPSVALLDARTPEEYNGTKVRAARSGHIPGAVNFNWLDALDGNRNYRLLSDEQLRSMLSARGIRPDQEVIAYCHTNHRSSHSYLMLRHLGYESVRAYPGSWSEWGNAADTPIET